MKVMRVNSKSIGIFGTKGCECFLGDRCNFRREEGGSRGILYQQTFRAGSHCLIKSVRAVLMQAHVGVGIKLVECEGKLQIFF